MDLLRKQATKINPTTGLVRRIEDYSPASGGGGVDLTNGKTNGVAALQRRMGNAAFTAIMRSYVPDIQRQDRPLEQAEEPAEVIRELGDEPESGNLVSGPPSSNTGCINQVNTGVSESEGTGCNSKAYVAATGYKCLSSLKKCNKALIQRETYNALSRECINFCTLQGCNSSPSSFRFKGEGDYYECFEDGNHICSADECPILEVYAIHRPGGSKTRYNCECRFLC